MTKIVNKDRESLISSSKDLRNFNNIFRKYVAYDNIKSHKKPEFQPLFRRSIFEKTTGGVGGGGVKLKLTPQALLELKGKIFLSLSPHYENT